MFDLTKWYADAVSAGGDFLVGYCARLRCGRFSASYSSVLDSGGCRHSLRRSEIMVAGQEVRWRAPALGIDAWWHPTACEIRKTIYRNGEGTVEWNCILPRGLVRGVGMEPALGYVECLRLTIAPWRLPIRRLRWGRFLSARHCLVWIDWQGDFTSRSVFLNGDAVSAVDIGDDGLLLSDGTRVVLDRGLVIRAGALGPTVLDRIPGLARVAPAGMFQVEERKWRSRATLERAGDPPDHAWCIHEVVEWP